MLCLKRLSCKRKPHLGAYSPFNIEANEQINSVSVKIQFDRSMPRDMPCSQREDTALISSSYAIDGILGLGVGVHTIMIMILLNRGSCL